MAEDRTLAGMIRRLKGDFLETTLIPKDSFGRLRQGVYLSESIRETTDTFYERRQAALDAGYDASDFEVYRLELKAVADGVLKEVFGVHL